MKTKLKLLLFSLVPILSACGRQTMEDSTTTGMGGLLAWLASALGAVIGWIGWVMAIVIAVASIIFIIKFGDIIDFFIRF